ncbi:MAG: replicative DNA helicase [Clostridia bacterium]|nr:replicative DNA helicase [Clostridia bacterium]
MDAFQKKVPFSVEAEQSVLGSIIIDPNKFDEVAQIISAEDFYIEEHKDIFLIMHEFNLSNRPLDLITLINQLVVKGIYDDEAAAMSYLRIIGDIVPGSANAKDYARIVHDKSILRKLITATDDIQDKVYTEGENVSRIVDYAEQKIYEIAGNNERTDFIHIRDVIFDFYDRLKTLKEGAGEDVLGLKSGFSDLDQYVVGFGKSDLIIVGARPGIGKTAFVLNIATNIAKRTKKAVAIFQLEMGAEQLVQRIVSSEALVDSKRIKQGNIENDDWDKIAMATSELAETDILIDANPNISVTAMKAKLRRVKNLGLVVIDYLQLMQGEKRKDGNRAQEVGEISRGLKIMAKELNVPVIVCAQLSRTTEKEHKKPMLSDLRESGSIEQDADVVMFLSRDYYGDDPEKANLVDVIVAKNRHGETGTVHMSWLGQYTKFSTLENDISER